MVNSKRKSPNRYKFQNQNFQFSQQRWSKEEISQRTSGIPILGDTKNLTRQDFEQPALRLKLAHIRVRVWSDDIQRSLPRQIILWFYDFSRTIGFSIDSDVCFSLALPLVETCSPALPFRSCQPSLCDSRLQHPYGVWISYLQKSHVNMDRPLLLIVEMILCICRLKSSFSKTFLWNTNLLEKSSDALISLI